MGDTPDTVAILFADICDSTRLYHDLGDAAAHVLATQCLKLIGETTTRNGGTLVKTIGDGAMSTFPSVDEAYQAAISIQDALHGSQLSVKIGLHVGPVIVADKDVYGDTVNLASRVLARSGPGEVLMSGACAARLAPKERATLRLLDTTKVKGRPESVDIYSYVGDATNVTIIVPTNSRHDASSALVLTLRGTDIRIETTGAPLLVGREPGCGMVIASDLVSRRHATIEVQRNSFVLTDHSSNGTFVVADHGAIPHFLRRESVLLGGSGVISFGVAPEENTENLVRYRQEGLRA